MADEEKEVLTEEEKIRKAREEAYRKQQAKVEKVAHDESSAPKQEQVKIEKPAEEDFSEKHVDSVRFSEEQEEEKRKAKSDYTGADIEILQGLEAVRQRPGRDIGSTASRGLHHLVREAVDNGVDEAMAGFCKHIHVTILPGTSENPINRVRVEDDGRGIPCDTNKQTGLSTVETVYTILHAGGKFNDKTGYKISGGLHGIGVKAVNALSTDVVVTVYREGKIHQIHFQNGGKTVAPGLQIIGDCPIEKTGTTVEFCPDPLIFKETTTFDFSAIASYLRQTAYLTKGLEITLDDVRDKDNIQHVHYQFNGGIKEYVSYINETKERVFEEIPYVTGASSVNPGGLIDKPITIIVEAAFQPTKAGILNINTNSYFRIIHRGKSHKSRVVFSMRVLCGSGFSAHGNITECRASACSTCNSHSHAVHYVVVICFVDSRVVLFVKTMRKTDTHNLFDNMRGDKVATIGNSGTKVSYL